MTTRDVDEYQGLRVGMPVILVKECGSQRPYGGAPQRKVIQRIRLTEWAPEEARRLNNPPVELLVMFTDGSCAGHYDRVTAEQRFDPL